MDIMKKCYKCQLLKNPVEFAKNKRYKDGLNDLCKLCKTENNIIHKEKIKEYYEKNKPYYTQYQKQYSLENKDKLKEYSKQYNSNPVNADKKRKYIKEYDVVNEVKKKEYMKLWRENNQEYFKKYMGLKYKNDVSFKIKSNIRSRFNHAIEQTHKSTSILKLIGCNMECLKFHLSSKFKPEFTWENHGDIWEIDHIKPCASFDLTNIEQQKECFHYTNLQPLFKTTEIAESFGYKNEIGNRNKNKY